jgi:dihydrodipicolinate synthase/N-acetylneuraminate lyase
MKANVAETSRRTFLAGASAVALAGMAEPVSSAPVAKRMRGIYPIAQTPCTPDNKLDLEHLAAQVHFCNNARVPGVVWPQLASGWITLSDEERFAGAEAMLAAAKGTSTEIVIGVQAKGGDVAQSARFAKHAQAHGASAVIALVSLPPEQANDGAVIDYYKAIGAATSLPLVMQATGNQSVDLVAQVCRQVPTLACIKDEAGEPLNRISEIRTKTEGKVAVFAGRAAHTFLSELEEGFDGNCPAFTLCDFLQRTFELWHSGKQKEAFEMYGRYAAFMTIPNVDPYGMIARGFFPDDTKIRVMPNGKDAMAALSQADKRFIKRVYQEYLKPYASA